jgi:hypothetical protein
MLLNKRSFVRKLSDEDIISLYKEKLWTSCIDELYHRYAHMVFGVCLKYVKQIENAEDLTLSLFASLSDKLVQHQVQHLRPVHGFGLRDGVGEQARSASLREFRERQRSLFFADRRPQFKLP